MVRPPTSVAGAGGGFIVKYLGDFFRVPRKLDAPPPRPHAKPDAPLAKPDAPRPDAPRPDAPRPDAPRPDARGNYHDPQGRFTHHPDGPRSRTPDHRANKGDKHRYEPKEPGHQQAVDRARTRVAERDAAADALRAMQDDIAKDYPGVAGLGDSTIRKEDVDGLRNNFGIPVEDAEDLVSAARSLDKKWKTANHATELVGESAADNYMAKQGVRDLTSPPHPGGQGSFDRVGAKFNSDGDITSIHIYEAKGGESGLGVRKRAEQGTPQYLSDVLKSDPTFRDNPHLRAALGKVPIEYVHVRGRLNGTVTVTEFVL